MTHGRVLDDGARAALRLVLPAWSVQETALTREITAASFPEAIALVVAIAEAAEELDHHPDVDIRWRTIRLSLSTHSAGGLTELDVELATRIDSLVEAPSTPPMAG